MPYTTWTYAALAEIAYRRSDEDQQLSLEDFPLNFEFEFFDDDDVRAVHLNDYGFKGSAGHIYNPDNGFSAFVLRDTNTNEYTIVFRGSDGDTQDGAIILDAMFSGPNENVPREVIDGSDWLNNQLLSNGTYDNPTVGGVPRTTQWESARILVEYVLGLTADANGQTDPSKVTVAGQSLGGGLAGLASIVYDIKGFAFGPAAFGEQLAIEANIRTIQELYDADPNGLNADFTSVFNSDFMDLPTSQQARLIFSGYFDIEPASGELVGEQYVNSGVIIYDIYDLVEDLQNRSNEIQSIYNGRRNNDEHLYISSVYGEFTTNQEGFQSLVGTALDIFSEDFRDDYNLDYEVGDVTAESLPLIPPLLGESIARHSPALHALLALTEDSQDGPFSQILSGNDYLRHTLFNNNGVAAPIVHRKQGEPDDPSTTGVEGSISVEPLYRALWKSFVNPDAMINGSEAGEFYASFSRLFTEAMFNGAAAIGAELDTGLSVYDAAVDGTPNLHRAITQVALSVLRDALQDTSDLTDLHTNLGGTFDFAGDLDRGFLVLPVYEISSEAASHLQENGLRFGVQELELFAAQAILNAAHPHSTAPSIPFDDQSVPYGFYRSLGLGHADILEGLGGRDGLSLRIDSRHSNAVLFSIEHASLIVQSGTSGLSLVDDGSSPDILGSDRFIVVGEGQYEIQLGNTGFNNLVIITGNDDGAVAFGSGDDFVVGGEGDTYFTASEGNDSYIGGSVAGESGFDVVDYSNLTSEIRTVGLGGYLGVQKTNSFGEKEMDALLEIDRLIATASNDEIDGAGLKQIDGGAGDDDITVREAGARLKGSAGADTIHVKSTLALLEDGGSDDRIFFGDTALTGAVGWGNVSEKVSITNVGQGVSYSINELGELIIETLDGTRQFFVANYDDQDQTAGIFTGVASIVAYKLLDPAFPGAQALINGIGDLMDAAYFLRTGQERDATDPLIIDLDGDGLELAAMSSVAPFFDLDGDGFAERTGWASGGDGFLALDLNSNGQIDDISELFGDRTTSGFAALAAYDANADLVIDASDAIFADLKVWVDANSDGVTDAGELQSLTEAGIASISLTTSTPGTAAIAGNTVTATAVVTFDDDSQSTIHDVRLRTDEVRTEYLGDTTVSTEAGALPNLKGSGELPSLRIAATQSADVFAAVAAASANLTTPDPYTLVQEIRPMLLAWADHDGSAPGAVPPGVGTHYSYTIGESGRAQIKGFVYSVPSPDPDDPPHWHISNGYGGQMDSLQEAVTALTQQAASNSYEVSTFGPNEKFVLGRFTGEELDSVPLDLGDSGDRAAFAEYLFAYTNIEAQAAASLAAQSGLGSFFAEVQYNSETDLFEALTTDELKQTYEAILSAAELETDPVAYVETWASFLRLFLGQYDRGEAHLLNTYSYQFANLVRGYEAFETYPAPIMAVAAALGIPGVTDTPTNDTDIFYLTTGNQTIQGGKGADSYVVGADFGQDVIDDYEPPLESGRAPDTLRFAVQNADDITASREGNDLVLLDASTGDTVRIVDQFLVARPSLIGGPVDADRGVVEIIFADGIVWDAFDIAKAVSRTDAADQSIIGTRGVDWFDGGAGDDYFVGGNSSDFYVFGADYGDDVVFENGPGLTSDNDHFVLIEHKDTVIFDETILIEDLVFERVGSSDDLLITHLPSGATLTVRNQFTATNTGSFGLRWFDQIEHFSFASDGNLLTADDIMGMLVTGTDVSESIYGFYRRDTIDGGAGDDFLSGGDEGDTYLFGRGDGQDTIREGQTNVLTSTGDKIVFKSGIAPEDVSFQRLGGSDDLQISIAGDDATLTVEDQFYTIHTGPFGLQYFHRIESFEFADAPGVAWSANDIMDRLLEEARTDGDDVIYGYWRNDVLDGGIGNDTLLGGNDSDTYLFGLGYGTDTISDHATNILASNTDKVLFGAGIALEDLTVSRSGDDLVLTIAATGDQLIIEDQHFRVTSGHTYHAVEQFEFADGTIVNADYWRPFTLTGTTGDETINGYEFADIITGGAGNDTLRGYGDGDTYLFELGFGNDTIYDYQTWAAIDAPDKIVFGAGLLVEDATFTRNGLDFQIAFTSGETLLVQDMFKYWITRIESIEFADGTIFTYRDISTDLVLQGTPGDDVLLGTSDYRDRLDGGAGNDRLQGSGLGDTYVFDRGYGHDRVIDTYDHTVQGGNDEIEFAPGISLSDLEFKRVADEDLEIKIVDTGETLTIQDGLGSYIWHVEEFSFADGMLLTLNDVIDILLTGTDGNDSLHGVAHRADTLDGGLGDDHLAGGDSGDIYIFGRGYGNDTIYDYDGSGGGYEGDDTVLFKEDIAPEDVHFERAGDDLLITIDGDDGSLRVIDHFKFYFNRVDLFEFANGEVLNATEVVAMMNVATDGDDVLLGSDSTYDWLDGGPGNDRLEGGDAGDRYIFGRGYGVDFVRDYDRPGTPIGPDRFIFIDGLTPDDVSFRREGDNLYVSINGTDDRITAYEFFGFSRYYIEYFDFDDGTRIDRNGVYARLYDMSEFDDVLIYGGSVGRTIDGLAGDDSITGGSGDDTFYGGSGDDTLSGRGGADLLTGGMGADLMLGGDGNDVIYFDNSDIRSESGMALDLGGAGRDTLVIETGSVFVTNGLSVYGFEVFRGADGNDDVRGNLASVDYDLDGGAGDDELTGNGGDDILIGGPGVDLMLGGAGDDVIYFDDNDIRNDGGAIDLGGAGRDTLVIETGSVFVTNGLSVYGFEVFRGADGNDDVRGNDGSIDYDLDGGAGDDELTGNGGDDILVGGLGVDLMLGAAGNDVVYFDDDDIRSDSGMAIDLGGGGYDTLIIEAGSRFVTNSLAAYGFEKFIGAELDDDVRGNLNSVDYDLSGGAGNDDLRANGGDDTLRGDEGNDTLTGGNGNDTLYGGTGLDEFVIEAGADQIMDFEAGDVIDLTVFTSVADFTALSALHTQDGSDSLFDFGEGNTLRIANTTLAELSGSDFAFAPPPALPSSVMTQDETEIVGGQAWSGESFDFKGVLREPLEQQDYWNEVSGFSDRYDTLESESEMPTDSEVWPEPHWAVRPISDGMFPEAGWAEIG